MIETICKLGGWYVAYEFSSSVVLAVAAWGWGLGFSGI
jgi:hypothetical protein